LVWLIVLALIVIIALVLYWQLILAEGAYLGAPLVTLLYDLTAERYNKIKEFDQVGEDLTGYMPNPGQWFWMWRPEPAESR
jgi:hypothetical protein